MGSAEDVEMHNGMQEAVRLIEACPEFAKIIPEIRTNLAFARADAKTPGDVLAVDGRITVVGGKPHASGKVAFGASSHVARLLLAVREHDSGIRAAINFANSTEIEAWLKGYCLEKGWLLGCADRRNEPDEVRDAEGASMKWKAEEAIRLARGRVPKIICDKGGVGKEPVCVLFGENPVDVAREACGIARAYSKRKVMA